MVQRSTGTSSGTTATKSPAKRATKQNPHPARVVAVDSPNVKWEQAKESKQKTVQKRRHVGKRKPLHTRAKKFRGQWTKEEKEEVVKYADKEGTAAAATFY